MQRGSATMKGSSGSTFKDWMEEQRRMEEGEAGDSSSTTPSAALLLLGQQFTSIGDSVTSQLQELSGALPTEAGPLSAAFRQRMIYSVYLLMGSAVFALLAAVVGLPTLLLRPAKFVTLMTLSTLCATSSVVVMQKPSVFFASLWAAGYEKSAPVLAVFASMLGTLYVAVVVHKYIYVLVAAALQILAMLYYLASFVPGGQRGLVVLLRTASQLACTMLLPLRLCLRQAARAFLKALLG